MGISTNIDYKRTATAVAGTAAATGVIIFWWYLYNKFS